MNPYVYSRRRGQKAAELEAPKPSLGELARHIASATVGTALAFAVVIFAAGSVASMTAVAYAEIGGGSDAPVINHFSSIRAHAQVLGDSTAVASQSVIDDSALEANDALATLSVKPGSFDSASGRWSATINYTITGLTGNATLSIGNYVVKSGITESGSVDTGSILKPSKEYRVTLWTTDSTGKQILAKAGIKTGKGKTGEQNAPIFMPCKITNGTSTTGSIIPPFATSTPSSMMCLMTKEGKMICPRSGDCAQKMSGDDKMPMPGTMQKGMPGTEGERKGQSGDMPKGGQQGSPSGMPPQSTNNLR